MLADLSTLPQQSLLAVLNHLLQSEDWARARLQLHRGQVAVLMTLLMTLRLQVSDQGLCTLANPDSTPNLTVDIPPQVLGKIAQGWIAGQPILTQGIKITGDAEFANTLGYLAQHLRWDAEHDLARLCGPTLAPLVLPVTQLLQQAQKQMAEHVQRTAGNVAEYLVHENPTLLDRPTLQAFSAQVQALRERLDRLQKHIEVHEKGMGIR